MPDFTPAEIRDARENPKVGDVWVHRGRELLVSSVRKLFVEVDEEAIPRETWLWFTRWGNATLIRRGA